MKPYNEFCKTCENNGGFVDTNDEIPYVCKTCYIEEMTEKPVNYKKRKDNASNSK